METKRNEIKQQQQQRPQSDTESRIKKKESIAKKSLWCQDLVKWSLSENLRRVKKKEKKVHTRNQESDMLMVKSLTTSNDWCLKGYTVKLEFLFLFSSFLFHFYNSNQQTV